jgi:hypothetical protein
MADTANKPKLRSFLGLCTHYRHFISSFADLAKLLTRSTKEKQASQWFPEVEVAFQSLKKALCTAPILSYKQSGELITDRCNVRIVGVLS